MFDPFHLFTMGVCFIIGNPCVAYSPIVAQYTILLDTALFFPMEYLNSDPAFPDRRGIVLALQPALGFIFGPLLEASMLLLPVIKAAWKYTPEEFVENYWIEQEVAKYAAIERANSKSLLAGSGRIEAEEAEEAKPSWEGLVGGAGGALQATVAP
jgi:hypothetical protein